MNKMTIVAALAMTGLVACTGDKDTSDSAGTTGGTTTGTTTGTTGTTAPTASVTWGAASVDLVVSGGPGAYWFGMAEAGEDGWTGEDCVYGYELDDGSVLAWCHDGTDTGTSLTYGGDAVALVAGTTVFTDASFDGSVTYYLESDPEYGGDGSCYVWGADATYYDGLGCSAL